MSEACQDVTALDKFLNPILKSSFKPITIKCDNKAALASAKTGGKKLRYMMEVREAYVKKM